MNNVPVPHTRLNRNHKRWNRNCKIFRVGTNSSTKVDACMICISRDEDLDFLSICFSLNKNSNLLLIGFSLDRDSDLFSYLLLLERDCDLNEIAIVFFFQLQWVDHNLDFFLALEQCCELVVDLDLDFLLCNSSFFLSFRGTSEGCRQALSWAFMLASSKTNCVNKSINCDGQVGSSISEDLGTGSGLTIPKPLPAPQ